MKTFIELYLGVCGFIVAVQILLLLWVMVMLHGYREDCLKNRGTKR